MLIQPVGLKRAIKWAIAVVMVVLLLRQTLSPVNYKKVLQFALRKSTSGPAWVKCSEQAATNLGKVTVQLWSPTVEELEKYYVFPQSLQLYSIPKSQLLQNSTKNLTFQSNAVPRSETSANTALWLPRWCYPQSYVAIIVPYRNRRSHLMTFLNHMHYFLRQQGIAYAIIIVEQMGVTKFNRATLLNIGFVESDRVARFDCFILHDVDLLPEDTRNRYECQSQPVHLSVARSVDNYRLLYKTFVGGVTAMSRKQFEAVKGLPNVYFGWGGEDDELYERIVAAGYNVSRPSEEKGRYFMLGHNRDIHNEANPLRFKLLNNYKKRLHTDGYENVQYKLEKAEPIYGGLAYLIQVSLTVTQPGKGASAS